MQPMQSSNSQKDTDDTGKKQQHLPHFTTDDAYFTGILLYLLG
jgi:hypothetical protein